MAEITRSLNVNTLNVSNTFVQQTSNVFPVKGSILVEPENHANRTIAIGNLLSDLTVTLEDPKRAGIRYHFVSSSQRVNTGTLTFKTQTNTNSFRGCVSNVSITALDSQEDDSSNVAVGLRANGGTHDKLVINKAANFNLNFVSNDTEDWYVWGLTATDNPSGEENVDPVSFSSS